MVQKIGFYILSLWLLFLLIIIITVEIPIYFGKEWEFVGFKFLITHNIVPIICIIFLSIGSLSYFDFRYKVKGTPELSFEITEIENVNYEMETERFNIFGSKRTQLLNENEHSLFLSFQK